METILKLGDKAKGFKFANETDGIGWAAEMTEHIGQEGEIWQIGLDYFQLKFGNRCWSYPLSLMHLAVVEEQPKVIEIDMSKVEKVERFNGSEWCEAYTANRNYRFTLKDENKIKIEQEIEELEEKIKELKSKL